MSEHSRATDGPDPASVRATAGRDLTNDELAERITRALRSRAATQPDVTAATARIEARLAETSGAARPSSVVHLTRRGGRIVATGVVISALAVAGAGAAAAANPYSGVARVVENVAHAVGVEWSAMPAGYTRAQYEAFWGAGYTVDELQTLDTLWSSDSIETKARAGQMILDGLPVPVTPGMSANGTQPDDGEFTQAQANAFWGAGYTDANITQLEALWNSDYSETKARAGQMVLDGQTLPVVPGAPATSGH